MAARAFLRRSQLTMPLITAVNGTAAGGRFELVLLSTRRIAAASARIGLSEVRRGLIPASGASPGCLQDLTGCRIEVIHLPDGRRTYALTANEKSGPQRGRC